MAQPSPRVKFTYEDYRRTPEDKRYELIDGDLIMVPSTRAAHQNLMRELGVIFDRYAKERGGEVYFAPFDVVLSDTDVLQPDILYISNERLHILTEDNVRGAPDLVIEILSPGTADRDRTLKRSLYARHGVREYWLVDPQTSTVEVLWSREGPFDSTVMYTARETLTSPLLHGLHIQLSEVF